MTLRLFGCSSPAVTLFVATAVGYSAEHDEGGNGVTPPSCLDALTSSCSTDSARAHSPFTSETCAVCCGRLQQKLRSAGCNHQDLVHYCDTPRTGWPILLPRIEIAPAVFMPTVSIGHPDSNCSWNGVGPGCAIGQNMTEMWMRLGGRGIDTAADYGGHQAQVGAAVRAMIEQKVVPNRSDVFITTKISPDTCSSQAAVAAVRADLVQLDLDYVDLVLQHFPCDTEKENQAVFTGLIQAKALGLTRSIGVSSFSVEQMQQLLSLNQDVPAVNQCQMAVGSHDDETRAFCELHNITYQAWSPISHVDFADPKLEAIAGVHNVSVAQVALRWITQQGCPLAVSPGLNEQYAAEDLGLGSFTLTASEMATISAIRN